MNTVLILILGVLAIVGILTLVAMLSVIRFGDEALGRIKSW